MKKNNKKIYGKKKVAKDSKNSQFRDIWIRFKSRKPAVIGLVVIILLILLALFADVLADYDSRAIAQYASQRLQGPSKSHIFGTDAYGRDLFARIIHGARFSLSFGIICVGIAMMGGCILGALSAFLGGKIDNLIMRALDVIMAIPGSIMMLALIAVLGVGFKNMLIAILITSIPGFARMVRSFVLNIVRQDYIEAAKACGVNNFEIIIFHVLPNAMALIIINAAMAIPGYIMAAAGLSFIGMGVQPPAPEWGSMINEATQYIRLYPHIAIFPGLFLVITSLSFNLLGDGLAEALDPTMKD